MIRKKSEDAVSPVIGVMLLLVVTIVIAAVVAVFASGVGADAEPAPTTVLDVVEVYDKGYSTAATNGGTTPVTRWMFDESDFVSGNNGILFYYYMKGEDLNEYESKIYNKEHVEFRGHDIYLEYGIWYIDRQAIVEPSGYVYEDKVDTDEFNFIKEYCEETIEEQPGGNYYPVTVTVNCLAGDTLDLAKVSINVYDKNGVLVGEVPQNSLSGTISTGESRAIDIKEIFSGEAGNYNAIKSSEKVEVFVLFGDHVLVSKDIKVRG